MSKNNNLNSAKNTKNDEFYTQYSDIEKEITCKLLSLKDFRLIKAKGVKMMTFDAEFKANISLPDYIGIGKHVSLGFGTVVRIYNENNIKR